MLTRGQIEIRVNRLLKRQNVNAPPVPIEKLAKKLGAVIRSEPYDGEVSGALYLGGDVPVIGINALDVPVRQRFTIAHEVGHLLLHRDSLHVHVDRHYISELVIRRDKVSTEATDRMEIEANRFAASLLMPGRFLRVDVKRVGVPVNAQAIEVLAKRYKVSQQAIIFRLMNLGVSVETV